MKRFGFITVEKGEYKNAIFKMKPGEKVVIGRDARVASIVINPDNKKVSRLHCIISYDGNIDSYRITDLSKNGITDISHNMKFHKGKETIIERKTIIDIGDECNVIRLN